MFTSSHLACNIERHDFPFIPDFAPHFMIKPTSAQVNDRPAVIITDNGNVLEASLKGLSSRFHAIWLRDNGQDDRSVDKTNGQKLMALKDIPPDSLVESALLNESQDIQLVFGPDNWHTSIPFKWLWEHRYDSPEGPEQLLLAGEIDTWDSTLLRTLPETSFREASENPAVLLDWLQGIARYGAARMTGLPQKDLAVLDVISLFGFVRETNYGRYFEIRSRTSPINLAYTTRELQPHTDNPYRDPVPGLQFFSCMKNASDGGDSILVDGFRIAEILHREAPETFSRLSRYKVRFRYAGSDDMDLQASRPIIQRDVSGVVTGISFNNRSISALTDIPYDEMNDYYRDLRRFEELVGARELQVRFRLEPGELFVTDNTRVLHGRTGYSNSVSRWMQGAYADKDALYSKIRVLKSPRRC